MSKRLLVMRFSALGDVAMSAVVLREFMEQNPEVEVYVLSRPFMKPIFDQIGSIHFIDADLNGKHKGFSGLYKLYKELKIYQFDAIADLHNVLRTKIIRAFFRFDGIKIAILDKARAERRALIRQENKDLKPLKPMTERYADVFRLLGFNLKLSHHLHLHPNKENAIGIAPFAQYESKMYPIDRMAEVAKKIAEKGYKVYLFGGKTEAETLFFWEKFNPNIISLANKIPFREELDKIAQLKVLISMDSANMHLASLMGTKAISIWGGTHPYMGFLGYAQSMKDVIQDEGLKCRPTSVFGKETSSVSKIDYWKNIDEDLIVERIMKHLEEG